MAAISVVSKPDLSGKRLAFVLAEDRVGHYPEFRDFFVRTFELDRVGLSEAGYLIAPSGATFAIIFIGRSGQPFPAGVENYVLVDALEPFDEQSVDRDLWAILRWMIEGVGAPWSLADLDATGKLYRIPAVS